ncbi:Sialic acid transporter NanT [subsurface metagenome]
MLTSIFYFAYYFGRYNFSVTIPYIQAEFGLSAGVVGLIASVLTAGYALGQFINGFLIDRYGPRLMMTLGGILSTIANVFMGFGQSFSHLIAAWTANGYVQAMGYGSCCKLYAKWFKRTDRGKPLGFNEALQGFSSAIILPLGALIIVLFGWRFVYWIPVIPLSLIAVFFYIVMRNTPKDKGFKVSWEIKEEKKSFSENAKDAYKMALSDWRMLLTYVSYGGSQFARFAIFTWVPAYIFLMSGNIIEAAWIAAFFPIGGAIGSFAFGWLSDRFTKRYPLIVAGMLLSAVTLIIFAMSPTAPIMILSALMFLCGVGIEAVEVCYFLLPMDILDEENQQATGVGCMNAWGKTFATFQGVGFGLMIDFSGFQIAFLATGFIAFLSALAVIPIRK